MERGTVEHTVTKADLNDLRDFLTRQIQEGFRGVHERQDVTNGRVNAHATAIAVLQDRGRRARVRRAEDIAEASDDNVPDPDNKALTRHELRLVMATLGAAGVSALFIWKVVPLIFAGLTLVKP